MKTELYRVIASINGKALTDQDKEDLLKLFMMTNNSLIRDNLAMLFSEIRYEKATSSIVKKIKDKKLYNNNGTLVGALRGLDSRKYFNEFITIILTQEYEARLWAFELVNNYLDKVTANSKVRAVRRLTAYKESANSVNEVDYKNSRLHFVEEAITLINSSIARRG